MVDYQSDFESDSEKSEDTLDLINASTIPLHRWPCGNSDDGRPSLTVLESPDIQIHDSRLSFDPIPIGHMRKLIQDGKTWEAQLPPAKV